jgi:Lrp/AsnC family leucine-responsive transcriptional regulator
MKLDRTDRRILELIQTRGRISNLELSDAVGLSPTPCARRVKRLEESGIIDRHVTLLNPEKLDLKLTAILGVSMDKHIPERFENFDAAISGFPEVLECNIVTGQTADYLLKVMVPDMAYYEEFLLSRISRIEGVTGLHSSFVLRNVVNKTSLPLDHTR